MPPKRKDPDKLLEGFAIALSCDDAVPNVTTFKNMVLARGGEFVDEIGDDGVDYVVAREEDLKDKTPTVEKALEIDPKTVFVSFEAFAEMEKTGKFTKTMAKKYVIKPPKEPKAPRKRKADAPAAAAAAAAAAVDEGEEAEEEEDKPPKAVAKKPRRDRKPAPAAAAAAATAPAADDGDDLFDGEGDDGDEVEDAEEEKKKAKKKKKEERKSTAVKVVAKGGGPPVDPKCEKDIRKKYHVYGDQVGFWDCMLNQTNVDGNNNKYYIIQLLEHDDVKSRSYYCWNRWGRVGYDGQNSLKQYHSLEEAKAEFQSKFRDKTRNHWLGSVSQTLQSFSLYSGKYMLLEMDYGNDQEPPAAPAAAAAAAAGGGASPAKKKEPVKSQLEHRVFKLVERICDFKMMNDQMVEIGYDAKKMPLGKLSKSTINMGYKVLTQIESNIKRPTSQTHTLLRDLTSQFYTIIPHDFGFADIRGSTINSLEQVKKKQEMLESLAEIEIAKHVLKEASDIDEHPADIHYRSLKTEIRPLEPSDTMHKLIVSYVKKTHGKTHMMWDLKVQNIFEIARQGEEKRFGKHQNNHNRMLLWHGSRLTNYVGILSQGLRIAPPEAPVSGYMFGKGVYFADMVSKSAQYCYVPSGGRSNVGVMMLAEVALGDCHELCNADYNADRLPAGKLSTKGLGRSYPDPSGFISLPNGVKVPACDAVETNRPDLVLQYNEYIVYSVEQICLRYLLEVEFQHKGYGGW
ncbi:unnamed protein product [Vitrella brassicaformis CCMP3155]|uniref:Poly [ADP-ribose] polymerase n=2 Tax=Vitrella brassicaformis TaxID=1169539 RepID=A0A0G4EWN9_VITBC|nr:unnamed protein product [Vitrella brassicaformis CCMP3155]|eukprot:CEM03092.1 unnamed protein product [Vitrella brassicaformis CCMP3155]